MPEIQPASTMKADLFDQTEICRKVILEKSDSLSKTITPIAAMPEDTTHDVHLLWMIEQIKHALMLEKDRYQWLGFIHAALVLKGYLLPPKHYSDAPNTFF